MLNEMVRCYNVDSLVLLLMLEEKPSVSELLLKREEPILSVREFSYLHPHF